jgi:hypothetical protein
MTHSEIIIELVKQGFSYTFDYSDGIYSAESRQIIFTKQGFKSTPILMSALNDSSVDKVKNEAK